MEHFMIPTDFECPPAPKKHHQLYICTDGTWEHRRVDEIEFDMPVPPTPKKNHIQMFVEQRWISVKKLKI